MPASVDDILKAAQSLPVDQRRAVARLAAEAEAAERHTQTQQTNLAIVRETHVSRYCIRYRNDIEPVELQSLVQ